MSNPNDTTTTLNSGSGGDVMDESLVYQSDGVTQAKRPRVVLALDSGPLVGPGGDSPSLPIEDDTQQHLLLRIARSLEKIELLLSIALGE